MILDDSDGSAQATALKSDLRQALARVAELEQALANRDRDIAALEVRAKAAEAKGETRRLLLFPLILIVRAGLVLPSRIRASQAWRNSYALRRSVGLARRAPV